MSTREARASAEQWVAWLVVAACTLFVFWQFYPELIFRDTTPVRGDLGEHLLEPAHVRDHLLPHGRLSGWSQDWFAGYPVLTFYFPLPILLAVLFDVVLPYNMAFKLSAAVGPVALPAAAYAFARQHERTRTSAALFSVAAMAVLLQPLLFNVGGSIGAAALGEYAYSVSLAFGVAALGAAAKGLRTGGGRTLTAVLIAGSLLSHAVPAATVAFGIVVLTVMRPSRARLWWTASTGAMAGALAGFWLVPLLVRYQMTSGPTYPKVPSPSTYLLPSEFAPVLVMAFGGLALTAFVAAVGGRTRRYDLEVFFLVMAVASGGAVALLGDGRIENRRPLGCWFLWTAFLAAAALSRLGDLIDERRAAGSRGRPVDRPMLARLIMPVAFLMAVVPAWDTRLGKGVLTGSKGDLRSFAAFFMEGYESTDSRAESRSYIDTMRQVARLNGCGRAHVEWNYGTWDDHRLPLTDLTPYWTDGCITVTSGLPVQSAATSPYLGYTNERLSKNAVSLRLRDEGKHAFDLAGGLADLRLLGVRYYAATDLATQQAADASPDLHLVAATDPYEGRQWKIYELADVHIVESLAYAPVVATSLDQSRDGWERAMTRWYESGAERDVLVSVDGPDHWPRSEGIPTRPPRVPVAKAAVTNVRVEHHRMSFDVAETGTPVVVKVSYFPNWRADGADGPWRASPNFMVVVPHSRTVVLRYARTLPDYAGMLATVAGIGAGVLVARRPPLDVPATTAPEPEATRPRPPGRRKPKPKRKGRR